MAILPSRRRGRVHCRMRSGLTQLGQTPLGPTAVSRPCQTRPMDLEQALEFAARHRTAALITIRRDGRPQSSDISYDVKDGVIRISLTEDRAKTKNLRRDPRAVLHVSKPDQWSYVSIDGTVELTDVASEPGDATCLELADQYESVAGKPHPDWNEYYEAMVADRRMVAKLRPSSAVGQVN